MSGSGYIGKSIVHLEEDKINKKYLDLDLNPKNGSDPLLSVRSSSPPPRCNFRKESCLLKILSDIPDEKRLSPKLYSETSEETMTIVMQRFYGDTFREAALAAYQAGGDVIGAMKDVPHHVAAIHHQLDEHQKRLIKETKWGNPSRLTRGLSIRTTRDEEARTWHYLRAIIYSLSPELGELREDHSRTYASIDRAVVKYLDQKGIDATAFVKDFVKRDLMIMYGVDEIPDKRSEGLRTLERKLLREKKLFVVHGDLGPQHLFCDGKYIDLDEARLAPREIDLVSALYNTYTSPLDSEDKELRMIELSFQYQKEVFDSPGELKYGPSAEEKAAFLTRVVESRLKETGLRLFAADCKASVNLLRGLTKGHPDYDSVSDEDLRQKLLRRTFVDGLQSYFFPFYTTGAGCKALSSAPQYSLVHDQLSSIQKIFMLTHVFDGLCNPDNVSRLERLIKSQPDSKSEPQKA